MANAEVMSYGAHIKQALANNYAQRGPAFGRAIARTYVTEILNVVAEVDGRPIAAGIIWDATDSVLTGIPLYEMDRGPDRAVAIEVPHSEAVQGQAAFARISGAATVRREKLWQWAPFLRAMAWWSSGVMLSPVVFYLFGLLDKH